MMHSDSQLRISHYNIETEVSPGVIFCCVDVDSMWSSSVQQESRHNVLYGKRKCINPDFGFWIQNKTKCINIYVYVCITNIESVRPGRI